MIVPFSTASYPALFDSQINFEEFPALVSFPRTLTLSSESPVYIAEENFIPFEKRFAVCQSYQQLVPVGKCPQKLHKAKTFTFRGSVMFDPKGRQVHRNVRPNLKKSFPTPKLVAIPPPQNRSYDLGRFNDLEISSNNLYVAREIFNGRVKFSNQTTLTRSGYRKATRELFRLERLEKERSQEIHAQCQGFAPDFSTFRKVPLEHSFSKVQYDTIAALVADLNENVSRSADKATSKVDSLMDQIETMLKQFNMNFDSMTMRAFKGVCFLACCVVVLVTMPKLWPIVCGMAVLYFNVAEIVISSAARLIAKLTVSTPLSVKSEVPKSPAPSKPACSKCQDPKRFSILSKVREAMTNEVPVAESLFREFWQYAKTATESCILCGDACFAEILYTNSEERIARSILSVVDDDATGVTQGDILDVASSIGALSTLLCTLTGAKFTGCLPSKEAVRDVSLMLNTGNALERAVTNISTLFKYVYKLCYQMITGKEWLTQPMAEMLTNVSDWMKRTQDFLAKYPITLLRTEISTLVLIEELQKEGKGYMNQIVTLKLDGYSLQPFMAFSMELDKIVKELKIIHNVKHREARPCWVHMVGSSRTGKTVFAQLLTRHLCARRGLPYDKNSMYDRKFTNRQSFWDGYQNQFCTTVDDILQQTNQDSLADQIMDMLYMCNEYQCLLNMADLDKKGNTFFTSSLVVTTSNRLSLGGVNGVVSKEAFQLRRDFIFRARVAERFLRHGVPDWAEIKRVTGTAVPHSVWEFDLLVKDFDTQAGGITGNIVGTYTFEEVLEMVDRRIISYKTSDNIMTQVMNTEPILRDVGSESMNLPVSSPLTRGDEPNLRNNLIPTRPIRQGPEVGVTPGENAQLVDELTEVLAQMQRERDEQMIDDILAPTPLGLPNRRHVVPTPRPDVQGEDPGVVQMRYQDENAMIDQLLGCDSSDLSLDEFLLVCPRASSVKYGYDWNNCLIQERFEDDFFSRVVGHSYLKNYSVHFRTFIDTTYSSVYEYMQNVLNRVSSPELINFDLMANEFKKLSIKAALDTQTPMIFPEEIRNVAMMPCQNPQCPAHNTRSCKTVWDVFEDIIKSLMMVSVLEEIFGYSLYANFSFRDRLYINRTFGSYCAAIVSTWESYLYFRENIVQGARFHPYHFHQAVMKNAVSYALLPGVQLNSFQDPLGVENNPHAETQGLFSHLAQAVAFTYGMSTSAISCFYLTSGLAEIFDCLGVSIRILKTSYVLWQHNGPWSVFINACKMFMQNLSWLKHLLLGVGSLALGYVIWRYLSKPAFDTVYRLDMQHVLEMYGESEDGTIGVKVTDDGEAIVQSLNSGDFQTAKHKKVIKPRKVNPRLQSVQHALTQAAFKGGPDPNFEDLLSNTLYQHLCHVIRYTSSSDGSEVKLGGQHGLVIGGRDMLTTKHFWAVPWTEHDSILLQFMNGVEYRCLISDLKIHRWNDTDVATVVLPSNFQQRTKMLHHFVELDEVDKVMKQVKLITWKVMDDGQIVYVMRDVNNFQNHHNYTSKDRANIVYEVINGFCGEVITRDGECGGIYVAYDASMKHKFLGFHTAYHAVKGACGTWLNQERFEGNTFTTNSIQKTDAKVQCLMSHEISWPTEIKQHLNVLGKASFSQLIPGKTKLQPSEVSGALTPPISAPALLKPVLTKDGIIDPAQNALRKWACPQHRIPPDAKKIMMDVIAHLPFEWKMPDNSFNNVVTLDEAMNGKEGTVMEPLEDTTSSGIPFSKMPHKLGGKKDHLKNLAKEGERKFYEPSTFLLSRLRMREEMARQGIRFDTLWGDCLKDERRDLERVSLGKTRLFCVGPLDYTVLCRKYFMRFADHCISNRHRLPMKIGINPDGIEWRSFWDQLNRQSRKKGVNFIAGDFSNFDMSLPVELTEAVGEAILEWFRMCGSTEEENQIRRVLLQEIYRSIRVHGNYVYECQQGVPSGHFLTALFNSILNYVIFKTCVFYVAQQKGILMDHEFFALLWECGAVGDDHVNSQDEDVTWFDQQILQTTIKYIFGMGYTDSTKSSIIQPFTARKDLSFLKRYFREVDGFVFAPLHQDILEEEINWVRVNKDDPKVNTWKNMDASLRGYMHWGRELFEFKKRQYNDLAFNRGLAPFHLRFDVLLEEWKHR